ncbi:helix-turn-helix domain-containing protein [Mesorhizobium sp. PL10]
MTSFQMPLAEKDRKIGRSIHKVQKAIAEAVIAAKEESGVTQRALAKKLGVNRSVINRRVTGQTNLTLYSMAELAWALDYDLVVDFVRPKQATKAAPHPAIKPSNLDTWVLADEVLTGFSPSKKEFNNWVTLIREHHQFFAGFASEQPILNDNGADPAESQAA